MQSAARKPIFLLARGLDAVGTGREVELVARGLAVSGHDVHVVQTSAGGSLAARLAACGTPVHVTGGRPVTDAASAARFLALAWRLRPAVIVAFGRTAQRLAAAARLAVPGVRTIGRVASAPRGLRQAWTLARLDALLATTPGLAELCGGTRTSVVPPGIDADPGTGLSRVDLAARLGLDAAKTWTLCVAPLVPESRLERLVWAIDQLGVVHKGLEHVLVGAGPLLARVRRRARVQELSERLRLTAHCSLLPDLLGHVRLVWQSGSVALGGAILDGMARGVPAVAIDSDAARQLIVDGETGRVVPALPESELPRRAFNIIEDDALAARFAAAARSRAVERFPAAPMVGAHVDAVERLLAG
jgi:glycosyltransferase involved in cell wall biosynthesis